MSEPRRILTTNSADPKSNATRQRGNEVEIPEVYEAPIEDVTGPQVQYEDRYLCLYTSSVETELNRLAEQQWYTPDMNTYYTWQAAFASAMSITGVGDVRIVKISLPCYILPKSRYT